MLNPISAFECWDAYTWAVVLRLFTGGVLVFGRGGSEALLFESSFLFVEEDDQEVEELLSPLRPSPFLDVLEERDRF